MGVNTKTSGHFERQLLFKAKTRDFFYSLILISLVSSICIFLLTVVIGTPRRSFKNSDAVLNTELNDLSKIKGVTWSEVYIPVYDIQQGENLSEHQFQRIKLNIYHIKPGTIRSSSHLHSMFAAEFLPAGQPITLNQLSAMPDIPNLERIKAQEANSRLNKSSENSILKLVYEAPLSHIGTVEKQSQYADAQKRLPERSSVFRALQSALN